MKIDNILIIVLLIFITLDFGTTIVAIGRMGATELNPMYRLGFTEFIIIKLFITLCAVIIFVNVNSFIKIPCLLILIAFYGIIVLNNIFEIYKVIIQ